MNVTVMDYADFKTVRAAFTTVSPDVYYFDDTAVSGNFFIYAIYWAGGEAFQVAVSPKPSTFGSDFPGAVKLTGPMAIS